MLAAEKMGAIGPYTESVVPPGVRSRFVHGINGLRTHVLEAGRLESTPQPVEMTRIRQRDEAR